MRPENAVRRIDRVLWGKFMEGKGLDRKSIGEIIREINNIKPELEFMYKKALRIDKDTRSGEETYGYKNIRETLMYISDRWNCSFRIRWLLDLTESGIEDVVGYPGSKTGQKS